MDLSSAWSEDKLPSSCDVIIHLAQSPHFRDFPNSALDVFKINIESPARLLDYAK
jgi:nucleoside-diphosphate-sugar epimerase